MVENTGGGRLCISPGPQAQAVEQATPRDDDLEVMVGEKPEVEITG